MNQEDYNRITANSLGHMDAKSKAIFQAFLEHVGTLDNKQQCLAWSGSSG
jgi:hypothetical protein